MTHQEILDAIKSMTLLEIKELVDAMKEEFGVTGAIAVAGGAAPAAAAAAEEEKTEFDVVLVDAGAEKIKVGVSKEEAEKVKAAFTEIGAKVEIK